MYLLGEHLCHGSHMEVKVQFAKLRFLLLPCSSGHQNQAVRLDDKHLNPLNNSTSSILFLKICLFSVYRYVYTPCMCTGA